MIKRRLALLALEGVLLLTACGQTKDVSTLTTPPPQSAAQVIAPVEDKTEMPQKEEKTEDSADAPRPVERADASENADNAAEKQPAPAETAPPAAQKEPAIPAPAPEDKPAPAPTPAPTQKPAEKQEEPAPTPEPVPAPEPKPEPTDRWAAVSAANAYAVTQYGVITDGSLMLDNSAYRFPASVSVDASQEALEAKARDMVDYTFRQLMMQAGADTLADAGIRCNVCIVEDGASLLIYVLYAG